MERKPAVAVIFITLVPYHHARLNAAADPFTVTDVEWSTKAYDASGARDSPPRYRIPGRIFHCSFVRRLSLPRGVDLCGRIRWAGSNNGRRSNSGPKSGSDEAPKIVEHSCPKSGRESKRREITE
jgi:hypothetical protein